MFLERRTLNLGGRLLDCTTPRVMGILNCTPDSFFDGGKYTAAEQQQIQIDQMVTEGADIIDVGGMSSRPGAALISTTQELDRVLPALEYLRTAHPDVPVSIDTVQSVVAREAVAAGAKMINDISAGLIDNQLFITVAELRVPYCLMHMQGRPETMQEQPNYEDVVVEVLDFLIERIGKLVELKVADIVIDPGFGFGKTMDQNYDLLRRLSVFRQLERLILVGISRKSMIYKVLETTSDQALNGTSVLHLAALQNGARLLRVHDVAAAKEVITLWQQLEGQS